MNLVFRLVGIVCLCLATLTIANSQLVDNDGRSVDAEEIEQTISDLGSRSTQVRDNAIQRLWLMGKSIEPRLKQLAKDHADPEVRLRATTLLEDWRYGLGRNSPPEVITSVRALRSQDVGLQQLGIAQLLRSERYELLLNALKFEQNFEKRIEFGQVILSQSNGHRAFLSQDRFDSFVAIVIGKQPVVPNPAPGIPSLDAVRIQLLGDPKVWECAAKTDGGRSLVSSVGGLSEGTRTQLLYAVTSNGSNLSRLCKDGDTKVLLQLIRLASTGSQRSVVASRLMQNREIVTCLARAGEIRALLEQDENRQLESAIVHSSTALRMVLSETPDVELEPLLKTIRDKRRLVQQMTQILRQTQGVSLALRSKVNRILESFPDPSLRCEYLVALVRQTSTSDQSTIESHMDELIQLEYDVPAATMINLMAYSGISIIGRDPYATWFERQLKAQSEEDQKKIIARLAQNSNYRRVANFSPSVRRLVRHLVQFKEPANRDYVVQFLRGVAVSDADEATEVGVDIVELLDESESTEIKMLLLRGLVGNAQVVNHLVANKSIESVGNKIDELDEFDDQMHCWVEGLNNSSVCTYLISAERFDVLKAYRNADLPDETKRQILVAITQSPGCINQLIDQGEFNSLEKSIAQYDDPMKRMLLRFVRNEKVIDRYADRDGGEKIREAVRAIDPKSLHMAMPQLAGCLNSEQHCELLGQFVWDLIGELPEDVEGTNRAAIYVAVFNSMFLEWYTEKGKHEEVLPALARNVEKRRVHEVVRALNSTKSKAWLEAVGLKAYLDFTYEQLHEQKPREISQVINDSRLIQFAKENDQLDALADVLFKLSERGDSQRLYLFQGSLARALLDNNQQKRLLEIVIQDAKIDYYAVQSMMSHPLFVEEYFKSRKAWDLLDRVITDQRNIYASSLIQTLFYNERWLRALIEERGVSSLVEASSSAVTARMRNGLTVGCLVSANVNPYLSDKQFEELFYQLGLGKATNATSEAYRLLSSSSATRRLFELGHAPLLFETAKKYKVKAFYNFPHVVDRMSDLEIEQHLVNVEVRGRGSFSSNSGVRGALLAAAIRLRGVSYWLSQIRPRDLWYDSIALMAVVENGEIDLLWEATPESDRRYRASSIDQIFRKPVGLRMLQDKAVALSVLQLFQSFDKDQLNTARFISGDAVAHAYYQLGLEEEHRKIVIKSTENSSVSNANLWKQRLQHYQMMEGQYDQMHASLRAKLDTPQSMMVYAGFLVANHRVDDEIKLLRQRPLLELSESERLLLVLLLRASGDVDQAIETAVKAGQSAWATQIAIESHAWDRAAGMAPPVSSLIPGATQAATDSMNHVERLVLTGLLAQAIDDQETVDEQVRLLHVQGDQEQQQFDLERYVVDSLILLRRVRPGLDRLKQHPWREFNLRKHVGFYSPAFARVHWVNQSADKFYDAISRPSGSSPSRNSDPFAVPARDRAVGFMFDLAQTLDQVGYYDQSDKLHKSLSDFVVRGAKGQAEPDLSPGQISPASRYQHRTIGRWIKRGYDSIAQKEIAKLEKVDESAIITEAFRALGSRQSDAYQIEAKLRSLNAFGSPVARARETITMMESPSETSQRLKDEITYLIRREASDINNGSQIFDLVTRTWNSVGSEFPMSARNRRILVQQSGDPAIWHVYAMQRFRAGDYDAAAEAFQQSTHLFPFRFEFRVMWGESVLRSELDDAAKEEARLSIERALGLCFAPERRAGLARAYREAGLVDQSNQQWMFVKRTSLPTSKLYREALNQLAEQAGDASSRVDFRRESIIEVARHAAGRVGPMIFLDQVHLLCREEMEAAIERNDMSAARTCWAASRAVNPNDAMWMASYINRVHESGHTEFADEMFEATRQFIDSRIEKFNQSDVFLIDRASLRIRCNRELDGAQQDLDKAATTSDRNQDRIDLLQQELNEMTNTDTTGLFRESGFDVSYRNQQTLNIFGDLIR